MDEISQVVIEAEIQEEELPRTPKKNLRIFFFIIGGVILLSLMGILVFSSLRSSPHIRYINSDALAVMRIDPFRLYRKANLKGEMGQDWDNFRDRLEELDLELLLDKPAQTGLLTARPSYFFVELDQESQQFNYFAVIPLSSGKKFTEFFKNSELVDSEDRKLRERDGVHYMDVEKVGMVWTNKVLLLGAYEGEREQLTSKRLRRMLDQPKSASIASNPAFRKANRSRHDLSCWLNLSGASDIARRGFNEAKPVVAELNQQREEYLRYANSWDYLMYNYYYGMGEYPEPVTPDYPNPEGLFQEILFENPALYQNFDGFIAQLKMLQDSSLLFYLDFNKGKVELGIDSKLGKDAAELLKRFTDSQINMSSLARYAPRDNLLCYAALQIDYGQIWTKFGEDIISLGDLEDNPEKEKYQNLLSKLMDGPMLLTLTAPDGNDSSPVVTLVASAREHDGIKQILTDEEEGFEMNGDGAYNLEGTFIFLKDDAFIITSDSNYYKNASLGFDIAKLSRIQEGPLAAFFSVDALLELLDNSVDSSTRETLEEFTELQLSSTRSGGIPDHLDLTISLKDKSNNSLVSLIRLIQDIQ